MSLDNFVPFVMKKIEDDEVAVFTVAMESESHMFMVRKRLDENMVELEHEESQLPRGRISTVPPRDDVYELLQSSEEFVEFVSDVYSLGKS